MTAPLDTTHNEGRFRNGLPVGAPAGLPDIHRNTGDVYRRKVARLAEALDHPEDRDAAASAIRGLIERIALTPSEN